MKIIIPIKRVVDYNVKIRVKSDQSGVELDNVKMSMNPFDEIAVEEAIRLKEAGTAEEIIALSIGPQQAQETIRTALAMGADRGILIKSDQNVSPLNVAKIIKAVAEEEKPDFYSSLNPNEVDEFLFALFLGGNQTTLPVYMWTQVRFPQTLPTVLALGTCIFLGSILLMTTAEILRQKSTDLGDKN